MLPTKTIVSLASLVLDIIAFFRTRTLSPAPISVRDVIPRELQEP